MSFFEFKAYKDALKSRLLERKKALSSFNFQELANACRVQKTYISRVFNGDAHLNEDQVYAACLYLGLSETEKEFVLHLHAADRSHLASLKAYHLKKSDALRKLHSSPSAYLQASTLTATTADFAEYYLDPRMLLTHVFLSIPEYANSLKKIAESLRLTEAELSRLLAHLERLGVIALRNGRYELLQSSLTLPADSPLKSIFRRLMRYKLLDRIADERSPAGTNYSVVFSADEDSIKKIESAFFTFLRETQTLVSDAPSKEVYQLNFDLEQWSRI